MALHNELGKKGEELATALLVEKGYEILVRNYRWMKGEIDIIARKDNIISIVEVKSRTTSDFGNPQEFLKAKQIALLVKTADNFVREIPEEVEVRFDIIAIVSNSLGTRLEHLENAYYHF